MPNESNAAIVMPPAWVRDYIGLPFAVHGRDRDGLDCYGLVALVSRERFGRDVPLYGDALYADDQDMTGMAVAISQRRDAWQWVREPAAGDVVLLRIHRYASHCGIMVAPDRFLHVHQGINTVMEKIDGPVWRRDRHVVGYYRWEGPNAV